MNRFSRLTLSEWQQFRDVDIAFHPRLTILTGANASGKTTILNILARHHDWPIYALATPKRLSDSKVMQFFTRLFRGEDRSNENVIGRLSYEQGGEAKLRIPASARPDYQVALEGQQAVPCFFVPSHRAVYRYQRISQIAAARQGKRQAFDRVWGSNKSRYFGGGDAPASYHMKETLIAWSVFGRGNPDMLPEPELLSYYEGFQDVVRKLLPPTLGFRRFAIRDLEIVLECSSGDFLIDAASGGLSTVIDLAWEIFMFSSEDQPAFTVLIDEVENHLHPTMQRRILPDLLKAFPDVSFIVSTHSPLIVNSVRDSAVYVLRYDERNEIRSERLDFVNKAKTAAEILHEVLGVSFTMPIWAEDELTRIVERIARGKLDESRFAEMRRELAQIGLDHYLPEALGRLLDAKSE